MLTRIETAAADGIPDVNYALIRRSGTGQGWIEMKHVQTQPVRPTSPVRYHYRPGQPEFLNCYWAHGGHSYIFAQVGRDYYLHNGDMAVQHGIGITQPRQVLQDTARYYFRQPWRERDTRALLRILATSR